MGLLSERFEPSKNAFIRAAVHDLLEDRGRSVVIVGPRQPDEVHSLAFVMNATLENFGKTVRCFDETEDHASAVEGRGQVATAVGRAIVGRILR